MSDALQLARQVDPNGVRRGGQWLEVVYILMPERIHNSSCQHISAVYEWKTALYFLYYYAPHTGIYIHILIAQNWVSMPEIPIAGILSCNPKNCVSMVRSIGVITKIDIMDQGTDAVKMLLARTVLWE